MGYADVVLKNLKITTEFKIYSRDTMMFMNHINTVIRWFKMI